MAKSKATQPLPWAAHHLSEVEVVNGKKRLKCATCGQIWSTSVTSKCPGLPVYGWEGAPEGLKTKTQLAEKRLKPGGQPDGLLPYDKATDGYVRLYLESEAVPMKERTDAQKAATEKAKATRDEKLTCSTCGHIMPSKRYMVGQQCEQCYEHERIERQEKEDIAEVVETAKTLVGQKFIIISAAGSNGWRPYQICLINQDGEVVFESLISWDEKPPSDEFLKENSIPAEAFNDAPTFAEVYQQLRDILHHKTVVSYSNWHIDVIQDSCWRAGKLEIIKPVAKHDVMSFTSTIYGGWSPKYEDYRYVSLDDACYRLQVYVNYGAMPVVRHKALRVLEVVKAIVSRAGTLYTAIPEAVESALPAPATVASKPDYCCQACGRAVSREEKLFGMEDDRCKACRKT